MITISTATHSCSAVSRAVKAFRLAPRSFIQGLRNPPRLGKDEITDSQQFAAVLGPAPELRIDTHHVVILSYLPLRYTNKVEALFARSLQERGWKVSIVTNQSTDLLAREYLGRSLGAQVWRIEDFLDFRNIQAISAFVDEAMAIARTSIADFKQVKYKEAALGLSAIASLTASQPDGTIGNDKKTYGRLRRMLRQSALLLDAAELLYGALRPSLVLCQEKGFFGTCETFNVALRLGIDYVQWVSCHEPDSVMFKRFRRENARDHPFSISNRTWAQLSATPWDERYRETVVTEFDRGYRSGDWFKYKKLSTDHTFADREELAHRLGLNPERKTAVIYSHILNDANLFYGEDLFSGGYEQWLVETVRAAAANPTVNWVLKLHPANVFRNTRLGYTGQYGELLALQKAFGNIPEFLKIIRPDEKMSPLSFFGLTDWGITVRGTVGMELPCFGIPVLTAGSGRYSNKGFTVDSATVGEYLERVQSIHNIDRLTEQQIRLGIRHAYFAFRGRPARYDRMFNDIYPGPGDHSNYRDIKLRLGSISEIIAHPQMRDITDFLVSAEEDFIKPGMLDTEEVS